MKLVEEAAETSNWSTRLGSSVGVLLCVTLVFTTLIYGAVDSGAVTLLAISTTLLLCLWAAHAWIVGEFRLYTTFIYVPILGWIVLGLIQLLPLRNMDSLNDILGRSATAALSFDQYATKFFLIRLFFYLVFLAAALTFINSDRRLRRVAWSVIVFGSVIAFFGILQWLAKPDAIYGLRVTPQAIPFGPFVNQHHFAALMEMTGGLTLGVLLGKGTKKDKQPLLLIATALMVVAILLTGSRGGLVGFIGVALFAAITAAAFRRNKQTGKENRVGTFLSRWFLPVTIVAAAILLITGLVVFLGGEQSLLRGSGIGNTQPDITSGRAQFWRIGLQIFLSNPIIGTGFDTFGVAFTRFDPSNGLLRVEEAHNDYLQTLADGGIVAFGCLMGFLYLLFTKGIASITKRKDPQQRSIAIGALAGCFGIAVHSFFDFPLRTPANSFFFLTLVALAIVKISGDKTERSEKQVKILTAPLR